MDIKHKIMPAYMAHRSPDIRSFSAWELFFIDLAHQRDGWEYGVKSCGQGKTLRELYGLINYTIQPYDMHPGMDLSLFKIPYRPCWEDDIHTHGGRWITNVPDINPVKANNLWEHLVSFVLEHDEVFPNWGFTGINFGLRAKGTAKVSIWLNSVERSQAMAVGLAFRKYFRVPNKVILQFQSFKDLKEEELRPEKRSLYYA